MDTRTILLDVGGTFIKCSDGRTVAMDSAGSRETIVGSLLEAAGDAEKVVAAVPGPFDYGKGVFLMKHKFASVYGLSFADILGSDRTYRFAHDVNAMLLGELGDAEKKGYSRVALVTLGTGLGFSMSIDKQILNNEFGSPLNAIYNLPYRDGVLEDYASKRGFLRGYSGITVKELADMAKGGDAKAMERFTEVGEIIAEAISPFMKKYGIECLKFGGQISRSFDLFFPGLKSVFTAAPTVRAIEPITDIDNATFRGLSTLL